MDLEDWSTRLKVFADATRVRLLALLEQEELTVAELSAMLMNVFLTGKRSSSENSR